MAILYKISNPLSSHFCKRFHSLISLQFTAKAYTFKDPREIARRSGRVALAKDELRERVRFFASGRA
jgi:hypothetical protein